MNPYLGPRSLIVPLSRNKRYTDGEDLGKRPTMKTLRSARTGWLSAVVRIVSSTCKMFASVTMQGLAPRKITRCGRAGHVVDLMTYQPTMRAPKCVQCGQEIFWGDRVRELRDCRK